MVKPEQSKPLGDVPPHTYGLPRSPIAAARAEEPAEEPAPAPADVPVLGDAGFGAGGLAAGTLGRVANSGPFDAATGRYPSEVDTRLLPTAVVIWSVSAAVAASLAMPGSANRARTGGAAGNPVAVPEWDRGETVRLLVLG
jgi:hypothetical protein